MGGAAGDASAKQAARPVPFIKLNPGPRLALSAMLFLIGVVALYYSYTASYLGFISQWIIAIFSLIIVGTLIQGVNGFAGGYGVYLLSTKKGIRLIDRISQKYTAFWNGMAVWGIVLGFGLLSWPFLKGRINKWLFAFGLLTIIFVIGVTLQYMLSAFQFINIPQFQSAISSAPSQPQQTVQLLQYLLYGISVAFGLTTFIVFLLLENTVSIIVKAGTFLTTVASGTPQPSTLSGILPGVAPLIPGIDIPLFAGVISLAILLIGHEFSHGILSRIAKVRLNSIGLVMLGIIPIGAFVEPDEKQVMKLEDMKQSRILAAGTSANFIMMFLSFFLLIVMISFVVPYTYSYNVYVAGTEPNYPAYGILKPGMQVLYWNGYKIDNITSLVNASSADKPGSLVAVTTNAGTYTFRAIASNATNSSRGLIGVSIAESYLPGPGFGDQFAAFLYSLFSLSLLFNFSLAVLNLLPVPLFDGWRLFKVNVRNNNITKAIAIIVTVLILINLLSWVFVPFAA